MIFLYVLMKIVALYLLQNNLQQNQRVIKQELLKNKRLYQYMRNYLEIITTVSSVLMIRSGTEENLTRKKELWRYLKAKDRKLFVWMRHGIMGSAMNLPGRGGRKISVGGYKICKRIFQFN